MIQHFKGEIYCYATEEMFSKYLQRIVNGSVPFRKIWNLKTDASVLCSSSRRRHRHRCCCDGGAGGGDSGVDGDVCFKIASARHWFELNTVTSCKPFLLTNVPA